MLFFFPYFMLTFHMFHEHGHSPIDYVIIEVGVLIICCDQFIIIFDFFSYYFFQNI
jgi:hypothetical protein